jgi:hypothetical protein
MKILSIEDRINLKMLYDEASLIWAALFVPNHAFAAPDFERRVGAPQSQIDEIASRLRSTIEKRADYPEYHQLALRVGTQEETKQFTLELSLSRDDVSLLAKAFKEAVEFTKEKDDFHTMTGSSLEEAASIQKQLDDTAETLRSDVANK